MLFGLDRKYYNIQTGNLDLLLLSYRSQLFQTRYFINQQQIGCSEFMIDRQQHKTIRYTLQIVCIQMDFDGLDDILEDNAYVPSFAPKETKKNQPARSKPAMSRRGSELEINSTSLNLNNTKPGGLFGLHKQATKKQPTTFEQFFNSQKEPQKPERTSFLQKNRSAASIAVLDRTQKQHDDNESIFSAQRTATRRPISREKEKEKEQEKQLQILEPSSPAPRRGAMMPPLSKKNQKLAEKLDTNPSVDFHDNLMVTRPVTAKYKDNDLDPLEALNKQQTNNMKKFLQQQIEYQKKSLQKIIQEERQSKKYQIQSLKRIHQQQLKKKLQLKDYELSKLKQFYEMQLSLKATAANERKEHINANDKIDQNLKQLKKIQTRINEQYSTLHNKQLSETNSELQRKQIAIDKRQKQQDEREKKLQELQRELKQDRSRLNQQQDRERRKLDEQSTKLNQREIQFESKYKRKEKQLQDQFDKKQSQLAHEKEKMRYDSLETQNRKMQVEEQQRQLKRKVKSFEDRQKQILQQLHLQRTKQMEREIEISTKLSEISIKESEVEMDRQELVNKLKILELERKKLDIQAKGSLKSAFPSASQSVFDKTMGIGIRKDPRLNTTGNFEQYQRTVSQMRDEMMRSMPKF